MNRQEHKAPGMDEFKSLLKKYALKATRQRLAVHEAMLTLGHASADMVAEEIQREGLANVTVASVYNILSQLALIGVYDHRMSSNNKMYFDVNTFRHMHLYDYVNNEYMDVVDDAMMEYIDSTIGKKRFKGYKVECVDVQIVCRPSRHYKSKKIEEAVG